MIALKVKYFNEELANNAALAPKVATEGSAGIDLHVFLPNGKAKLLAPNETFKCTVGLGIELESKNMVALVLPRSSSPFGLQNTVGVIDSDYRGEIFVKVKNMTNMPQLLEHHARLFQLMVMPIHSIGAVKVVNQLGETLRGTGGDGSTTRGKTPHATIQDEGPFLTTGEAE